MEIADMRNFVVRVLVCGCITACVERGDGGDGGSPDGSVATKITVSGVAVDVVGQPVANAIVVITGRPPAMSDAKGRFTISDVSPPYDLSLVESVPNAATDVTIVAGLTTAAPIIPVGQSGSLGAMSTARVTGNISGTVTLPAAPNTTTLVRFESADAVGEAMAVANPYSMDVSWFGPPTQGTLHVLQFARDLHDLPSTYAGYGKISDVALSSGSTAVRDIVTRAVPSAELTGSTAVPEGLSLQQTSVWAVVSDGQLLLADDPSSTGSLTHFTYHTPVLPDGTIALTATAAATSPLSNDKTVSTFDKRRLAPDAAGVAITLATPPLPNLPAEGATNLDLTTQTFSWTPMQPGGLYVVEFKSPQRTMTCITAATSVTLPPTQELGLGTLPAGTQMSWSVSGYGGGAQTTDVAAAGTMANPFWNAVSGSLAAESWFASSPPRHFTTR
jgi:hypothetical protein